MSEPFIGEIRIFAGNFAPRGWAFCNGQLMSIAQNSALFSILGTAYGGDGVTTFALPDLQGRVPMHWGNGAGLTPRQIGEKAGEENVTLLSTQMPAHTHQAMASSHAGVSPSPIDNVWANSSAPTHHFSATPDGAMSPTAIGPAGGSLPHSNVQPYQCLSFIIAREGIFPCN